MQQGRYFQRAGSPWVRTQALKENHMAMKMLYTVCKYIHIYIYIYVYGGFQKWYPTTMGFPTKNDHFGMFWGYHHLRKHPCIYNIYPLERDHVERKLIIFQPSVFRGYVTLWGVKHQILWWGIIPRCILTSPFVLALLFAVFSWLKQKLLGG